MFSILDPPCSISDRSSILRRSIETSGAEEEEEKEEEGEEGAFRRRQAREGPAQEQGHEGRGARFPIPQTTS